MARETLVIPRGDVARVLRMPECIAAVERGFLRHALGQTISPGILATHVEGGGFHVKAAGLLESGDGSALYAAKVNANFPGNPDRHGLPTIQGVIALFDGRDGRLLALLDSGEITCLRTAGATAVAAKYLGPDQAVVTICGCGEQSRSQLRALAYVCRVTRAMAYDLDAGRAKRFAADMTAELGLNVTVIRDPLEAAGDSDVWVTCTTARRWFLGRAHIRPGAFVAAVGADNPEKQELEPALLAGSAVVADILDQSAAFGDLHHAISAGLMCREDVRAELADVVSGRRPGRLSGNEVVVFDSTGTALEDVAVASLAYERARAGGAGLAVDLGQREAHA